ncbi:MAG TPA: hypothetical protein VFU88_13190 [Ktedonobacterales bacterium]|nr:hypothetical protein [Ktedonobacterales bacterium]
MTLRRGPQLFAGISKVLAWLGLAACIAGASAGYALFMSSGSPPPSILATLLSFLAYPTIGALIVSRRPQNTVGWIFCAIGLGTGMTAFSGGFVQHAIATGTDAQLATGLVDAIGNGMWIVNLGLGSLLLFLFPDGRLPSRRWRPIFWLDVAALASTALSDLLRPGPLEQVGARQPIINPLGIPAIAPLLEAGDTIGHVLIIPLVLTAIASLIVRYRHAQDAQRQQIKWFVYGAALMALIIAVTTIVFPEQSVGGSIGFAVAFVMLPLGAGIGVLRYRLYDIDVIINRTLVYGSLTLLLALVYFASVIGMQQLVRLVSGTQAENNPLVIVLSTLLIAALFQPLRRRIQATIDHRFYRSRYDAARTLERFAASLRGEIELAELGEHLVGVVEQTMRPAHVGLWLRPQDREARR